MITPYINDNSNGWIIENNLYYYERDSFVYNLQNIGHYGFTLIETLYKEVKSSFDFIVNYDPTSDKLTFDELPKKMGRRNS